MSPAVIPAVKKASSPRTQPLQRGASPFAAPSSPSSCPASSGSRPFAGRCGRPYAGRRGRPVAGRRDRPVAGRRFDEEDVQGVSAADRCPSPLPRAGAAATRLSSPTCVPTPTCDRSFVSMPVSTPRIPTSLSPSSSGGSAVRRSSPASSGASARTARIRPRPAPPSIIINGSTERSQRCRSCLLLRLVPRPLPLTLGPLPEGLQCVAPCTYVHSNGCAYYTLYASYN